jgi:hypothetical protein
MSTLRTSGMTFPSSTASVANGWKVEIEKVGGGIYRNSRESRGKVSPTVKSVGVEDDT